MRKKINILIGSLLFSLAMVELSSRFLFHNPYINENTYIQLIRMRYPDMDYTINRKFINSTYRDVKMQTDGSSYYLPSFRFPKPDKTIVFFGGSTTECAVVDEELRFPALVSTLLQENGYTVNSLNIARSGNTVHDSLNILLNHVISDRPDIAIIMHAANDIGVLKRSPGYKSRMAKPLTLADITLWLQQRISATSWSYARLRYIAGLLKQRTQMAARYQESGKGEFAEADFRSRLIAFIALCRSFGIQPVLMTQPYAEFRTGLTPVWLDGQAQDRANQIIREVGANEGVSVIDLITHMKSILPNFNTTEVFYDSIHVTNFGSQIEGKYISEFLINNFFGNN